MSRLFIFFFIERAEMGVKSGKNINRKPISEKYLYYGVNNEREQRPKVTKGAKMGLKVTFWESTTGENSSKK